MTGFQAAWEAFLAAFPKQPFSKVEKDMALYFYTTGSADTLRDHLKSLQEIQNGN